MRIEAAAASLPHRDYERASMTPEPEAIATSKPSEMAKSYDPRATEDRVYRFWESRGYFKPAGDPSKPPFSST